MSSTMDMRSLPSTKREQSNHVPFSKLPPKKIVERIFAWLSIEDVQNCRLVNRQWNIDTTEILSFAVKLSDMTILPFLRTRRPVEQEASSVPKLNIVKISIVDLSPLSAPFPPEALQEHVKYPKNVHTLQFLEGVSAIVKQNFLSAFKWVRILKFEKTPIPTFPQGLVLEHVTTFEMSPGAYNESDELKTFFHSALFPSLIETSLQIHSRSDYALYAAAHFFVVRHYRTLKHVKLLFLESISMICCYDMDIYAADFKEMILDQKRLMEKDPEYQKFLKQNQFLQLETLNLWLIDNEEFLKLSLHLIDIQTNLIALDINHPHGYRNINSDFSLVIKNNWRTLKKITIPRLPVFNCRVLKDCTALEEFSLGMEFHFYDFENFGNVTNIKDFPCLPNIQSVSMGSPLNKEEIYWMLSNVPASTFLFVGSQEEEKYSLNDIKRLIECERSCSKKGLMMCISMDETTFKHVEHYLNKNPNVGVRVLYHCKPHGELSVGTVHFSVLWHQQYKTNT